jgi:Kef-type K+ transport system membrane component KefB
MLFMEIQTFLMQLILILFSARVVGELAAYFKAPSVIGELCAGILIGPSVLNIVQMTPPIYLLAQIGIILLLFEVGLETDVGRLAKAGVKALTVAVGGVVLPFAIGFGISTFLFHFSTLVGLFVGCTLTATSIGITLRVLGDLKKQNSNEAQIILGAAVIDDILGIVFLSLLYEFASSGGINFFMTGKVLVFIVLFFVLAPIAAKLISGTIKKWEEKSEIPGLLPTMIVSLILLFAWIAHALGAPELLGGFAAGLALSRQFFLPLGAFWQDSKAFTHRVEEQMRPIVHLFTPIFFVSIGLSLNLKEIEWGSAFIWTLTATLLIGAILGKLFCGFPLWNVTNFERFAIGIAMIPRGEVGLIFAEVGLNLKIFDNSVYASVVLVIAFTTLLAPFALRWLYADTVDPAQKLKQERGN